MLTSSSTYKLSTWILINYRGWEKKKKLDCLIEPSIKGLNLSEWVQFDQVNQIRECFDDGQIELKKIKPNLIWAQPNSVWPG
jgi:hypothetical protein